MRLSSVAEQWAQLPPLGLAVLHLLAAALLVAVGLAWGRHGRRWLLLASVFVTVSAITLIYRTTIRPSDIPIDWITILTRGFESKSIAHLYTKGAHVGVNFAFVLSVVTGGSAPTLHDVVWLNLLLALVNTAIFFHLATYVAGRVWGFAWTVAFALNPATFLASFSELPTNLLALYSLAGVFAWGVLNDSAAQPRTIRAAAGALCALLTVFVALTRIEVSVIGLIALALYVGHVLLGSDRWSAARQRLRAACERPLVFLNDHPAAVAVLCLAAFWGPQVTGREEVAGLYPFNPSILGLFIFLPMLAFPLGVSIAVLFGFVHATIHFRRFGGLPLSLLVIVRSYFGVQDSYLEMGRYLGYVLPAILLLGLFGKEEFDAMAQQWRPNWYRVARVVYVMSWFTLPLPGVLEFYLRSEYTEPTTIRGGIAQLLLDRNTQMEVRHLLALVEQNPQCVFVGRVVEDRGDFRSKPQYDYVAFGAPIAEPIFVPEKDTQLDDFVARYAAGASCVRLHYGSDCNVRFGDYCKLFIAGRRLLEQERFWSRPYNSNPWDSGAPEIVFATYAWP